MISHSTILGIIFGIALFSYAIVSNTDNYTMFLSVPSLMLVLGGTIAATLIAYRTSNVFGALGQMIITMLRSTAAGTYDINRFVELGQICKKEGIISLPKYLTEREQKDWFLVQAVDLLITGHRPERLKEMLEDAYEADFERRMIYARILHTMGAFSPAFGMVGTLIGLIIMLDNLQGDPSLLGKGLALALITTLYGVLLAQLLFKPAAAKVQQKMETERFQRIIASEACVLISTKADTVLMQDRLNSFYDPKNHIRLDSGTQTVTG